jgi:anti-sigma regulatory factor (Ser/Thr protein kinase)
MSKTVAIHLPAEPESARRARKQLEAFRSSLDEVSFVDLCLLVNELVVEALRTSDGATSEPIELRAERDGERVRVLIAEGGGAYELPSRRPEPGTPGFGLHLVQRLSDRWGMRRDRNRATVWLEMLRSPLRSPPEELPQRRQPRSRHR